MSQESTTPGGRVVVVGSAVVGQSYRVETLPFPGEVAMARESSRVLGGSGANQAVAARHLGAATLFVGRVGEDDAGRETEADLQACGVDLMLQTTPGVATGTAVTWVDDEGQMAAVGHPGANASLSTDDVEAARAELAGAHVVLAGGAVPPPTVRAALEAAAANEEGVKILDLPAPVSEAADLLAACDVVVTDARTAERLVEVGIADVDDALAALRGLHGLGAAEPVIFLGPAGAVCFDRGRATHVPMPAAEPVDPSGVDDAFKGALAALLAEGRETADAVGGACRYAALAIGARGGRSSYPARPAFDAVQPED